MKYKIYCKRPKEDWAIAPEVYAYDNQTNEIWAPDGKLIDFAGDERFSGIPKPKRIVIAPVMSPESPVMGKSRQLRTLKIQLGMKCNYHCSYCLQAAFRDQGQQARPEDADGFIRRLTDAGIEMKKNGRIELWGGEPLVYIKVLRRLIPLLRKKFGTEPELSMVTNGSLLTHELVDFFYEHRVQIIISHDGTGFSLRNDRDPLMDPQLKAVWLYAYEKYKDTATPLMFNTVLSEKNCDLFALRDFFRTNFAPEVHLNFEGVLGNLGANEGNTFSDEARRTLDASVWKALIQEPGEWDTLEGSAFELMRQLVHRIPAGTMACRCNMANPDSLVTDLKGAIGGCQNRPVDIFNIGRLESLDTVKNDLMTHWQHRPCRDCLVLSACKAGCPMLTDEELHASCRNEFALHSAVFGAVWFRLTGRILIQAVQKEG